jgi:hypothetical protein
VGLEPVLLPGLGFMRVPGSGVNGGDHPVRGDLPGNPPPPVGPVRVIGRFHVLPGDEGKQRVRIGRLALQGPGIDRWCGTLRWAEREEQLSASEPSWRPTDPSVDGSDLHEYIVPVDWEKTVPIDNAFWMKGLFANQNSACKLRHEMTITEVSKAFGLAT